MADKIFPWTELEPEEEDYLWDCIDTEITELPDLISWCIGSFISLSHIESSFISHIRGDECIDFVYDFNWGTVNVGTWVTDHWESAVDIDEKIQLANPVGWQVDFRPTDILCGFSNQSSSVRVSLFDGLNNILVDNETVINGNKIPIIFAGPIGNSDHDIDRVEFISTGVVSSSYIKSDGPTQWFQMTGDFEMRMIFSSITEPGSDGWRSWWWFINSVTGEGVRGGRSRTQNDSNSWYVERTFPDGSTAGYQRVINTWRFDVDLRMERTIDVIQFHAAWFDVGAPKLIGTDPLLVIIGGYNGADDGTTYVCDYKNLSVLSGTYIGTNPDDAFDSINTEKWTQHIDGDNPNNSIEIISDEIRFSSSRDSGPFDINNIKFCG